MASLLRVVARQGCRFLASNPARQRLLAQQSCLISTSKKNKDSATISEVMPPQTSIKDEVDENWISYGYDLVDPDTDEWAHKMTMFLTFSLCVVWGGFILAYRPDHRLRDWSQREAYLELARREKEGIPLVDPNIVDPQKIALPSDGELGDMEIII